MNNETLPADWAIKESLLRARTFGKAIPESSIAGVKRFPISYKAITELARMIEKYEQPPVDNAVLIVREMMAAWDEKCGFRGQAEHIQSGDYDDKPWFQAYVEYLRPRLKEDAVP